MKTEKPDKKIIEEDQLTEEEKKAVEELEAQLRKMIEKDEIYQRQKRIGLLFSPGLHHNFFIHNILIILINTIVLSSVIPNPFNVNHLVMYFLGVLLFTFFELYIKLIVFKFLSGLINKSLGLLSLVYVTPLFYLSIVYIGQVTFDKIYQGVVVFILFVLIRFILSYYIRTFFYSRRNKQ